MSSPKTAGLRVAVIGAGWAGCAAAVELSRKHHHVTLFEAARVAGGRARAVELHGRQLDNGQHILLGAYDETLRLMKLVGIDLSTALLRLPLQMRYPPGAGGMDFLAPRLPAPLHLLAALLRVRGLAWADKLALLRFSSTARWMGWRLHNDCSVEELLQRFDQTEQLTTLLWRPLCIAALNTPPAQASAQVFLNVLRDSLGARRKASDMLLPKVDLGALFPQAALSHVRQAGGAVLTGAAVRQLLPADGRWQVLLAQAPGPEEAGGTAGAEAENLFDHVILATPPWETARLLASLPTPAPATGMPVLAYEPITTCYLQYDAAVRLPVPFYALVDDAASGAWGQFVFDRGHLHADQAGLLAVVVSASGAAIEAGNDKLTRDIVRQLAGVLNLARLATPRWSKVITEKRATFACTPGLLRAQNDSGVPGLGIAGDHTAGDYPATLESAVRSGIAAARLAMPRRR